MPPGSGPEDGAVSDTGSGDGNKEIGKYPLKGGGRAAERIPVLRIILFSATLSLALNIFFNITGLVGISESFEEISETQMNVPLSYGLITYGILVPLLEELMFRFFIFKGIRKFSNPLAGMVLSSIIFGFFHGNIVQGIYAFLMGMAFSYVYHSTGRFWSTVLMHSVANITIFVIFGDNMFFGSLNTPIHFIIFFAVAINCFRLLYKQYPLKV